MQLATQLAQHTPGSKEWLELRRQGLGASEVPAILGFDKYKTPFQLWLEKTNRVPVDPTDSPQARVGRYAESMIANLYADTVGLEVIGVDPKQHPDLPFLFASADRAVFQSPEDASPVRLLEIKNRGGLPKGWGEAGSLDIPESVYTQVVIQSACYGIRRVDVAALLGGNDFRIYPIDVPDWLVTEMLERVNDWWQTHVVGDREPTIEGVGAAEYLAKKFREHRDELIEAPDMADQLRALLDMREQQKALDDDVSGLEVAIKARIGDAAGIIVPGIGKVTWKKAKDSTTTDWKALAHSFSPTPEQIAAFDVTKPGSRRFLVTGA